jgi:hypothetical protein
MSTLVKEHIEVVMDDTSKDDAVYLSWFSVGYWVLRLIQVF